MTTRHLQIGNKALTLSGRFPRILRIRSEHFDPIEDPVGFVDAVKADASADIFTFYQSVWDSKSYPYHVEWDEVAVLRFESYEWWWTKKLNDKTRNMVRKSSKKGVEIRTCFCDDDFVKGIKKIYDESSVRQGKPSRHYGKDLGTLKASHTTFLERSEFIGAYFEGNLIGFIKMVYHGDSAAIIMQIIAMNSHRDKAPTNGLLAKAVEICAAKGIQVLQYGVWSRRGLGDFKQHHGFERTRAARYYIPLNIRGRIALRLGLHRSILNAVPENWVDRMAALRSQWYTRKAGAIAR